MSGVPFIGETLFITDTDPQDRPGPTIDHEHRPPRGEVARTYLRFMARCLQSRTLNSNVQARCDMHYISLCLFLANQRIYISILQFAGYSGELTHTIGRIVPLPFWIKPIASKVEQALWRSFEFIDAYFARRRKFLARCPNAVQNCKAALLETYLEHALKWMHHWEAYVEHALKWMHHADRWNSRLQEPSEDTGLKKIVTCNEWVLPWSRPWCCLVLLLLQMIIVLSLIVTRSSVWDKIFTFIRKKDAAIDVPGCAGHFDKLTEYEIFV